MLQTAVELLEAARQLPRDEQLKIAEILLGELPEDWQETPENPEPGYEDWFHAGVAEALADDSTDISHEQVAAEVDELLHSTGTARRLKASA